MQKKVVFDFDGTLADTFGQMLSLVKEFRPDLSKEQIEIYRELGAKKAKEKLGISLREIFRIMRVVKIKQKEIITEAEVFDGMDKLIARLREEGVEVGILSSNSKENIEKWLKEKGIEVDWVRSESTIFGKEKAIKKVKSEGMFYVGDEVRDVEACRKIGVKIIAVDWGYNLRKALIEARADWVVEEAEEIRKLVLSLSH